MNMSKVTFIVFLSFFSSQVLFSQFHQPVFPADSGQELLDKLGLEDKLKIKEAEQKAKKKKE